MTNPFSLNTPPGPAELCILRQWLAQTPSRPEPDAMLLAAWLDGRLDETEAVWVESWLSEEPERLEQLLLARTTAWERAPRPDIRRAKALVSRPVSKPQRQLLVHWPAWSVHLVGGSLGLAGGSAGLALGLALAHWHGLWESHQLLDPLADLSGMPGVW